MKKNILLVFVLLVQFAFSQTKLTENEKYKQIGLVWGLLKYHHPEFSKGKYDWNAELIRIFNETESIENQENLNFYILTSIKKYNEKAVFEERKIKIESSKLFLKNEDYSWINTAIFGNDLTKELKKIKENGNIGNYYVNVSNLTKMVSFENEKGIEKFDYKNKYHRLLTLFSLWNVIQYWDTNKYLTNVKWFDILDYSIDNFLKANTKAKFEISKLKIIAKLNDSHSTGFSAEVKDTLFKYSPCIGVKILNDSMVISTFKNKVLAKKNGLELGDVIVKIKNKNISTYLKDNLTDLISAGNSNQLKRWAAYSLILSNNIDSINVDVLKKDGVLQNKFIKLYENFAYDFESINVFNKEKYFFIKPDIAYINLEQISEKELKTAFNQFENTKGLVIDLRNYPKNITNASICKYLLSEKKEFIKVTLPINSLPSISEYDAEAPLDFISNPFKTGKNNSNFYKGKVILLVDRNTISKAEFIGMSIQQSINCVTIGEQTGGAVANIVEFTLPDKTPFSYTGYSGFYPTGEEVQRNGLHIDYLVKETAKGYNPEAYTKEAIRIIEEQNK